MTYEVRTKPAGCPSPTQSHWIQVAQHTFMARWEQMQVFDA